MTIKSFVCVECSGRMNAELMVEAEAFADGVDLTTIDASDPVAASDELFRQFVDATPEWAPAKRSEASDPRSGISFAVVQR